MHTKCFLILLLACLCCNLHAQVTIGSNEKPAVGALLHLTQGSTTSRGLGLPRVQLTEVDQLYPMFEDGVSSGNPIAEYTGAGKIEKDASHTGLVVYNIAEDPRPDCAPIPTGIHVWDGDKWQSLIRGGTTSSSKESFDAATGILTDRNGYTYHTGTFGVAGRWMTQNLRTEFMPTCDNDLFIYEGQASDDEAQYHYPNAKVDEPTAPGLWAEEQGLLYNWYAATNGQNQGNTATQAQEIAGLTPGANEVEVLFADPVGAKNGKIQGICPKGWHLPSDREWNQLEKVIAESPATYSTGTTPDTWNTTWETSSGERGLYMGTAMKANVTLAGRDAKGESKAADANGFYALLTGDVNNTSAYGFGRYGHFWSSSLSDYNYSGWRRAMYRYFEDNLPSSQRFPIFGKHLHSIRCKQD